MATSSRKIGVVPLSLAPKVTVLAEAADAACPADAWPMTMRLKPSLSVRSSAMLRFSAALLMPAPSNEPTSMALAAVAVRSVAVPVPTTALVAMRRSISLPSSSRLPPPSRLMELFSLKVICDAPVIDRLPPLSKRTPLLKETVPVALIAKLPLTTTSSLKTTLVAVVMVSAFRKSVPASLPPPMLEMKLTLPEAARVSVSVVARLSPTTKYGKPDWPKVMLPACTAMLREPLMRAESFNVYEPEVSVMLPATVVVKPEPKTSSDGAVRLVPIRISPPWPLAYNVVGAFSVMPLPLLLVK